MNMDPVSVSTLLMPLRRPMPANAIRQDPSAVASSEPAGTRDWSDLAGVAVAGAPEAARPRLRRRRIRPGRSRVKPRAAVAKPPNMRSRRIAENQPLLEETRLPPAVGTF